MTTSNRQSGFTLIELMTVVAIVGMLTTAAVLYIKPSSYAGSTRGFAEQIAAQCDTASQRAVATRRIQRIEVQAGGVYHLQATEEGMGVDTTVVNWDLVGTIYPPVDIEVASADDRSHAFAEDGVPAPGDGLDAYIDFFPNGTAQAASIFVRDLNDTQRARVVLYRATGAVFVFEGW